MNKFWLLIAFLVCAGCAVVGAQNYDALFGEEQVQTRISDEQSTASFFHQQVKPVIDNRCVVCHGCYDAPCQLKMTSPEGIDRGISDALVYDGTRLLASDPTRLFVDARTTQQWREKGFSPVLNEREQSAHANLVGSVMYQSLALKQQHPLPEQAVLGEEFDFSLDRAQTCPTIEEYSSFAENNPLAGMPYGLPAINEEEMSVLTQWLQNGAQMSVEHSIAEPLQAEVDKWESFLNQDSNKARLSARYIYEHWYLANIYFDAVSDDTFFKLIRSRTPPGQPIDVVATRRPYEDPKAERVYYRLVPNHRTVIAKTHIPLALNDAKLARVESQFIEPDYAVNKMPGYDISVASNPFKVFAALPVNARYQFMLDEAELIIRGFIQGPVCRGQIALNVINDQFWVAFVDPDLISQPKLDAFLLRHEDMLDMPAQQSSNALPITSWVSYANKQAEFLSAKTQLANEMFEGGRNLSEDLLWKGEGHNQNAALTIFRHFNSATVVKGWVGETPKTAWILDYSLFERIHYLLVAGFDVYGNVGHQLITRLYMDFLRMEGEDNFLALLPPEERKKLRAHWYRKAPTNLVDYLKDSSTQFVQPTSIEYETDNPKQELLDKLADTLEPVMSNRYDYTKVPSKLQSLNDIPSQAVNLLPQVSVVMVKHQQQYKAYSLIHHNAHFNISSLLNEQDQRAFAEDKALVVPGFIGDYPEALWFLDADEIAPFVEKMHAMRTEQDYKLLKDDYAIRRTTPTFWQHSDLLHEIAKEYRGIEYGLFDYNRLENR